MITTTPSKIHNNRDDERRRALAKVYRLLIKLAEETEDKSLTQEITDKELEESVEPTPVQLELL